MGPPRLAEVLQQVTECCADYPYRIDVYVFGSAAHSSKSHPSDIDILVVYQRNDLNSAHELCNHLRNLITYPPLDVLALSEDEEAETDFIGNVEAKKIWPPEQ
ncbi:nucleotidyltransferase domain-containing protein [Streptomyces sp. SAI-127]|uniref:nucleotidyltransferase domain-containing protein n=1 Tax=Streptomyces sp. SAI-127 TaxID=2940543 RepID=UPI002476AFE5|nr:nucleotidyltransferase domain-containing protein [Streptomyces sp. SAI-127]